MSRADTILLQLIKSDFGADKLANIKSEAQAFSNLSTIATDGNNVAIGAILGALSTAIKVFFERKVTCNLRIQWIASAMCTLMPVARLNTEEDLI